MLDRSCVQVDLELLALFYARRGITRRAQQYRYLAGFLRILELAHG